MFKLESYITPILMGYVDKYIKLRTEDFQLSLWGGDAVLYNLDLRLDVLEKAMQLPIVFQSGHIHELRLHIPWTKLGSEPVVVTINTIECILKLRDTAYSDKGSTRGGSEVSSRKSGSGQRQKMRRQEGEDLPPGYLQSLMNKIVNNVCIIVNNLIIKFVEDDIVFSMNMKSAEIYSVNKDWVRAFVELTPPDFILRRAINICDLTICLDKRDASGRIENYQDPLVYRCSVSSQLYMKYDSINAKFPSDTKLDFYCDRLDLSVTDTQLPMFIRLVELGLALYYGTMEFKNVPDPKAEEPEKQKMSHEALAEAAEGGSESEAEDQQGWGQWAWSFVPQILEDDEPVIDEVQERRKPQPSVFSLGTYAYKMSITFKLTEHTKEKAHYGPRKISFKPFLYLESEGISMEVVMQGLIYFNVQCGITNLRIFSQGNCICGARSEENSRNNMLLSGGDALPNKTVSNYLTQSLFDSHSARNLGIPSDRVLDWDYHLEAYTEQHSLDKYGIIWTDYLYVLTKNEEGSVHSSRSSVSEHDDTAMFAHENSLSRFVIGPCHLNVASTTVHRIQKILDCAYKYDYEPYAKKQTEIVDDNRPHPTEDQMRSMEEFVPTRTYHLTLLRPIISLLSAEHAHCDIAKKTYHSKPRSSRGESSTTKLYPLFGVQLSSERFDLQIMTPMYPRKLVRLVSKIAGPPSSLLHHCYSHTQMKLFGFHVGMTTVDTSGTRSPLVTLIPTTSGALYTRRLLLPMYWKNSYLPKIERVYELPQITLSLSKAGLMVVIEILSSWQQKNPRPSEIGANTLMEDVFPQEDGEKKPMSLLEMTMTGFEMKTCRNDIVSACSGTVSSAQVLVYTSDGATTTVTSIMSSSTNTEHLHTSDWLSTEDSSALEDKNDCFTFTYQLPRKYDQIEAPAVVLVNMEGLTACLDPVLLDWLQYCPRQKVVPSAEKKIDIDLELAKAASPLQGNISQVSQASSGSTRQHTDSLTVTHSLTPRTVTGVTSHGEGERRKAESPDRWSERLATIFPVVRLVQVQVEVKKMCLFLPKTHLQLPDPSVSIPQNLHRLARSRSLPDTVVVCLPHVTIQSAGHKPVSSLQEIPITSMDGSLVGEKIPWNVSLKNFSVYSIHQQSNSPWKALQLLKPTTVSSTVGVSYKYNPPTSDDISALGLCLHTDMHNVTGSISAEQVTLLAELSSIYTKVGLKSISLLTDISTKLASSDKTAPAPAPRLPPTPEPLPGQQTLTSVTSHTEGDGLVTETSYDLGSMDTTPSRELEILEDVSGGVKLSLWLQWTLPRCELRLYCLGKEDQKLSLLLEDITMSIDVNEIYSKLKMNLGAANIDHFVRASPSDSWQRGPKNGIIMSCRGNLSHDTHILSTRLWSADHLRGVPSKASAKINSNQREVTHGFMNLTFTRALRKNVKKRFQKMNIDIPALQDTQTYTDVQFYFHKYVSEICVSVSPCDFVVCFSAIQKILGSFSSFEPGQKTKQVSRTQSQPKAQLEKKSKEPKPFMTSSNLPLIYADFSCVRVFIPREKTQAGVQTKGGNMTTTLDHDLLMMQIQSISMSPQADNPLPRYPVRKDLWQRAVQLGVTNQPGSALLDRQYQIDLSGLSLSTGCWDGFVNKAASAQPPPGTPGTQIPALEWNALQSLYKEHEEIQLFPIVSACEVKLVAAPSVVHITSSMEEVLVCGHSIEVNITSDLDLHTSTNQIHLIQKLVSDSLRCLTPPSDSSYELLDDIDSVKDSGIGSDVSASTMATVQRSKVKDTAQESSEGKVRGSKVMTPFNVLLTAGRISCMVYSHKIAESDIKLGEHHVKSEVEKKPLGRKLEWKVDSDEESDTYDDEGYEHVDAEAEFEEFSFMNIHEASVYDNEVRVIAKGSNYVQPFLYFYLSQPHLILSCQTETQKFEMSCYDILVKGPVENALFQAIESKLLPDCSDYTVYWLETRAGQPDLTTGIPPSLYTLRITDFLKEPAGFTLKFERPVKLNLSLTKLEQVQQLSEALFPEKPVKRSKVTAKDESSRSLESKSPGVQAILNKVKRFELQTDQVVVAMETQSCDHSPGLNASFTSFTIEADLQHSMKGELDNISSTSYVRDLFLQTKYDRRLSSLLGPFSVKIDGTFSHCCYDNKHFLSQSLVTIATGLVVINVGQEHVLCLDLIAKHLQDLRMDSSSNGAKHQSEIRKVKQEPVTHVTEDFIVHKSVDDLRSGSFQYRVDSDCSGGLPRQGEIIFCDRDKEDNSNMTWSYSHPRLISYIRAMPVPFNVSGERTEEVETRVFCSLQYWEDLVQQFVDYAELEISETDITYADLPDVRTASTRDLVVSSVWRLVIKTADQTMVLPASLAASVKIDSCFIPSLIPSLQVGCTLESLEVHLSNHLHCLGSKTPTRLEPFYTSSCGPASEEFAVFTIDNILCAGAQFQGQQTKTSLQFSAQMMVDVLEYKMLTMQKLLAPCDISGVASLQPKPKPTVIDLDVTCDKVDLKVGRGIVHTLSASLQAWNQTISQISAGNQTGSKTGNQTGSRTGNQTCSQAGSHEYQPLFGHYVICNDTQQPIRFGQAGTDENLVLQPREMHSYSWRSHKVKQSLHICVDGSTWKWCQPFNISETGTIVRKVTSLEQNYTLIIKIIRLSNVQNQIIISGQLHVSNRLDLPVEVKVITKEGSHDQRSVGQPGHTIPSYILELSEIQGIKFHCPGRNIPWSKEVFIGGEKLKENNLVKLHLPDKKSFHVWCRVFAQNVQTATRVLVVLCPLYIVRSHLPCPVYINIDTSKLNIHRQIEAPGQGLDLQLQCAGGDIHHSVTFQFSKNSAKSSSGVTLSTGLIDQLSRSEVKETEFDKLDSSGISRCQQEWPYCGESVDRNQILTPQSFNSTHTIPDNSDTQPTIDLNISLSELWPGCSTVLIDVTPWCLFTNLCNLDLVLMGSEDRTFQVSKGCTISPPKVEGSFHIGVQYNDKVFMSAPIPVSEEEVGAQRYRNDVGKTLYLDSWVHMAVFTEHQNRVYFLTITSSVQHQMRTIAVRERYCLTNYTKLDLSAGIFAVPQWSDKVSTLQQSNHTVPRHQSSGPGDCDLQCLTFLPLIFSGEMKNRKYIDHNTEFILYLRFQHISEETGADSEILKSDWSFPMRLTANENGCRMTGSVQVSKGGHSESKPLCITGHVRKSVTYFVIREDTAPACLIKNKCPFRLLFGQTLMNLTMSGATIQEQTEIVHTLPSLASDREVYYTPPSINTSFPEITDRKSFPKLHLSGIQSESSENLDSSGIVWSKPVDLLVAADTFVKIPDLADARVHVQQVALVTHVTIEPITKAEVSAKEIRSRLKGKETTVLIESKQLDFGNEIIKEIKEELSEKTHKKAESYEDSKLKGKSKDPVHQYNVGLFVRQFSLIVQDELSSPEIQGELLRLTADDIFAAWYPASAMLEDFDISRNCFVISAGDLQLDNQIHDQGKYDFPVVLVRQNYERPRTVHDYDQLMQMNIIEKHAILKSTSVMHAQVVLSSFKNRNSVIESVELTAKPLSFYVDDTFVFRVIKEMEGFIPTPLSFPEALPVTLLKLPPSVKSSSKTGSCPVRIGHLSIEQLAILMSVHASLKLFIASDHTPLTFGTFEKSNLFTTGHQLTRVVVMHYASGALFKAGAVVGSLEILGNPTGLVRSIGTGVADFFRMPYRGLTRGPGAFVVGISSGTSSMVKNITTGMLTSITNFASSVSRNMDRLSLDSSHQERQEETRRHRPDGVSDGLKQGLTGLGLSVLGAIAGLADQPIQNIVSQMTGEEGRSSKTAAAGSLVTGVGKGLVGVITKPIGGAAEFVSQTGQGILHGSGLSRPPKPRCEICPPVLEGSCGQTKYAQKLLQSIPSCDILFNAEAGFVDITDIVKPVTLILTPEILFVVNHEDDIQQQAFAVAELECGVKMGESAVLTVIWRDSLTEKLDEPGLTSEERVAAFIDSTILPARVRRDSVPAFNRKEYSAENSSANLATLQDTAPVSVSKQGTALRMTQESKVTKQQATLLQMAEVSAVTRQQGTLLSTAEAAAIGQPFNSVINKAQLSDSDSSSSVIGDSISMANIPQYDFHISAPKLAAFLAIFNITKRKLEGSGFAL